MIPRDLHFAFPDAFWNVLWLIPLLLAPLWAHYQNQRKLPVLIHPKLLPYLIFQKDPGMELARIFCFILGWLFAVIALMQPQGDEYYPEGHTPLKTRVQALDLYLLIDTSQSMAVTDTKTKQSRLDLATDIADRLIAQLKGAGQIALYSMTSQLTPLVPLTFDHIFIRLYLREIKLNEGDKGGTDFVTILNELRQEISQDNPKAAVLFSDGENTEDNEQISSKIDQLAKQMRMPFFTIGIGSKAGGTVPDVLWEGKPVVSRLNASLLENLAKVTGGRYWEGNRSTATELVQALDQLRLVQYKTSTANRGLFHEYFQIPLALACLCFLLSFGLPSFRKASLLILLLIPSLAQATNQGEQLFEAMQYNSAASWYLENLNQLPSPWLRDKLLYNLSVTLGKLNDWNAAQRTLNAISAEAYNYPVFRNNILKNQITYLLQEADQLKGNSRSLKLQEAALLSELLGQKLPFAYEPLSPPLSFEEENLLIEVIIRVVQLNSSAEPLQNYLPKEAQVLDQKNVLPVLLLQRTSEPEKFLERASEFLTNNPTFIAATKRFYTLVLDWQKGHFQKGECQCTPWDQVMPLFTEGLAPLLEKGGSLELANAYAKWQEALQLLKNPQSKMDAPSQENDELKSLSEMQSLDSLPKSPPQPAGAEGKPW